MREYLYFQPEYVGKFKCDGARCNARCCCQGWNIAVDKTTYEKYSALPGVVEHLRRTGDNYVIATDERGACPFLTEKNLCGIQLEHGENFLSTTCATYPRQINDFGNFFERALTLTCPVAAEMILFAREPVQFEFVQAVQDARINSTKLKVPEKFLPHVIYIQAAMISILQERTLSIDGRLIVLGFLLDKLDEISAGALDEDALTKLIAAYESKKFLTEQVPRMLAITSFDAKKFVGTVLKILETLYGGGETKFLLAVSDTLQIVPDDKGRVSLAKIAANYERLAAARKNFRAQYATLLENYLVNEIFLNCYPWRFTETITINYGMFVAAYKIFELMLFAATLQGFDGKGDLLALVDWYTIQTNHSGEIYQKIFRQVQCAGDIFTLTETLLER